MKLLISSIVSAMILQVSFANNIKVINDEFSLKYVKKGECFAKNEVLILFKEGFKITDTTRFILSGFTYKRFKLINGIWVKSDFMSTENMIKFFKKSPLGKYIKSITPNYRHSLLSNDKYYDRLWAIENKGEFINGQDGVEDADMDIKEAWEKTKGSHSVVVAILDTGVDYTHEDLIDNMWDGEKNHGFDFAGDMDGNNDDDPMPDTPYNKSGHYHGTHVAGVVGAVGDNYIGVSGINQNVKMMALKVFRPDGHAYSSDILEALEYVINKKKEGVNIVAVNASYGSLDGKKQDVMSEAIMKLGELGIIFCAASGNESSNIDRDVVYPASYNNSNIITVGASTQEDKLASFSNYGKNSVDVVAPGVNILSTYPDNSYAYMHGTSMATPYVTGLIALISAYKPDLTMEEKIKIIKDSVDKKDAFSEVKTGGRVNANRAIELIDKMSSVEGEENEDSKSDNVVENTPPVAKRDYAEVTEGGSIVIHVLINDSDADGDKLVILNATEPKYGKINIYDNGIEYISNGGYVGEDSFTYKISDEKGGIAKGRVVVNVKRKKSFLWWLFN